MTGTSAGASLCVYLAAMLKSPELAKAFQVVPNDLKIRALGLASGMYYTTKPDSIGIFLPSYIYGKHWKKSSFYPYINPENKENFHPEVNCCLRSLQALFFDGKLDERR